MILYNLRCGKDHIFESWFRDSATYDRQAATGGVECPVCGSAKVEKAIMAPRVARSAERGERPPEESKPPAAAPEGPAESPGARPAAPVTGATLKAMREVEQSGKVRRMLTELRRQIEENFDNVGPRFAQEARKIHYGEGEERAIYGETTDEEARELHEEGVQVRRIPWLPREDA